MKFSVMVIVMLLGSISATLARDKLILASGEKVKGVIVDIAPGELYFKKNGEIKIYKPSEVSYVFLDPDNTVIIEKIIANVPLMYQDLCSEGTMDARNFHKRGGGNFALGFFFGVFGYLGVALTEPRNPDPAIVGAEKMQDTVYMLCYEKKAKKKNLTFAGIGWAVGLFFVYVVTEGLDIG